MTKNEHWTTTNIRSVCANRRLPLQLPPTKVQIMAISKADIENYFIYHNPVEGQQERYQLIRQAAKDLALTILINTAPSADQTAAIRKLRECVMTANQGIACESVNDREIVAAQRDA